LELLSVKYGRPIPAFPLRLVKDIRAGKHNAGSASKTSTKLDIVTLSHEAPIVLTGGMAIQNCYSPAHISTDINTLALPSSSPKEKKPLTENQLEKKRTRLRRRRDHKRQQEQESLTSFRVQAEQTPLPQRLSGPSSSSSS